MKQTRTDLSPADQPGGIDGVERCLAVLIRHVERRRDRLANINSRCVGRKTSSNAPEGCLVEIESFGGARVVKRHFQVWLSSSIGGSASNAAAARRRARPTAAGRTLSPLTGDR
ncbi:hypothetical protein [Saccharothrix sp. NRRL B-16314]|uniref:hypothetical protein n=1 Tax=Saccharothrix sp. NRRL B-16314 TaxID=1463825 RepID=UPI0012DCDAA5|nr:hypothetical protein [Saccharothrix sp. NRRL B-16314]